MKIHGHALVATGQPTGDQLAYGDAYTRFARQADELDEDLHDIVQEHPEVRRVEASIIIEDGWGDADEANVPRATRERAKAVWDAAREVLGTEPRTGGCRTFYTPEQWRTRGEVFGCDSALILVHDGGDFAAFCNYSYEQYALMDQFMEGVRRRLGQDALIESCTCWYAALYLAKGATCDDDAM